ncbi:MAG: hypothetical protein FJ149_11930 [Euryarchaeota archaeon]|nr:hypothetical protein [Euryarchaeota archaeon]
MNRKIRKLTEMIEGAKKEARELEDKLEAAKAKLDAGRINKAEFSKVRMQLSESIKGKRTVVARWEKARLNEERRLKDKREEEEEELEKRRELRIERRRERDKERRRRARGAEGGEGEEPEKRKKKGFLSFLFGR